MTNKLFFAAFAFGAFVLLADVSVDGVSGFSHHHYELVDETNEGNGEFKNGEGQAPLANCKEGRDGWYRCSIPSLYIPRHPGARSTTLRISVFGLRWDRIHYMIRSGLVDEHGGYGFYATSVMVPSSPTQEVSVWTWKAQNDQQQFQIDFRLANNTVDRDTSVVRGCMWAYPWDAFYGHLPAINLFCWNVDDLNLSSEESAPFSGHMNDNKTPKTASKKANGEEEGKKEGTQKILMMESVIKEFF